MEDRTPDNVRQYAQSLRDAADRLEEVTVWAVGDADLATGWIRQAAAVLWWRSAREDIPPEPTAALCAWAERCRRPPPGSLVSGLFRSRSGPPAPTLEEIANELDALAHERRHPLSAVRDRLAALFDTPTDGPVKRLSDLPRPNCLLGLARDAGLQQRLWEETPPGWHPRPAAAAAVARLLLHDCPDGLAQWLCLWCADFRLRVGTTSEPPAGSVTAPAGWWLAPPPASVAPSGDEWSSLPSPPRSAMYECPILQQVRGATSSAERVKSRSEFGGWIRTDRGTEFLDWFLKLASSERHASDAARHWWRAIRNDGWVTAYPDYDPDTGEVSWPPGVPMPREAVETVSSTKPAEAILAVEQFAADPMKARVRVSDGPDPAAALERFYSAVAAADAAGWGEAWADGRWAFGRALALGRAGDAAAVVAGVLKSVADHPPVADQTAAADAALAAIRSWAAWHGLTVTPERWTFAGGCERGALPESAAVTYWFRTREPHDRVYKVRRFGVRTGEEDLQTASVSVSAGPPPAGFAELKAFVNSEPARPLAELLSQWATAKVGGYLPDASIGLFEAFWGPPGSEMRAADPAAAEGFARQLAAVLADLRLTVFHPQSLFDFADGWVQTVGGSPPRTGRVRVVHRPGIRDDANNLRLPALVEVE